MLQQLLHEGWIFHFPRTGKDYPARVPGCIHTDLRRNDLIPDPFWGGNELELQWVEEADWTYSLRFEASPDLLREASIDLVAEGLDTLAAVTLNDQEIARTEDMFVGYRWNVKPCLRPGENDLKIHFASPLPYIRERLKNHFVSECNDPVGGSATIRKQPCSFGWDWGPRFVTCGIYQPIRLEGYSAPRLDFVRVEQNHRDGVVRIKLQVEQAIRSRLLLNGALVAEGSNELTVRDARLWWPNGHGEQPLYELVVENSAGAVWRRRIGLRSVELRRRPDEFGESFEFVVNGRPIFAKGANWIPQNSFVSEYSRERYDDLLTSAADAHMNMLRVWGGGIYEMDEFYDLCDEKGILIWQDFMFACALYPADEQFFALVRAEAQHQVKRLQHRACLSLWCGNNELEQQHQQLNESAKLREDYERIFYKLLPETCEQFDGTRTYWPSSPHNPDGYRQGHNNENRGDAHFWDVWHARKPVKNYEKTKFRFVSEFGMQAYPHPEIARTFCPEEELNVFAPAMENHQKNAAGNQIIFDYVSRLYRFPKDYASLAYLSQLNQAHCIKTAVEHFRRSMPRTMGALYWQLNDCWPVASWSGLEFDGRWRALHYAARRFFAPALISAYVPGDESAGVGNYRKSTIREVQLWTVYDAPNDADGEMVWELWSLASNQILRRQGKTVVLRYGQALHQETLDFADDMNRHGAGNLFLRISLSVGEEIVSEDTVFLTAPRNLNLQRSPVATQVRRIEAGELCLRLCSDVFQHRVEIDFPEIRFHARDNYFDLYPDQPREIHIRLPIAPALEEVSSRLRIKSLVESYQ